MLEDLEDLKNGKVDAVSPLACLHLSSFIQKFTRGVHGGVQVRHTQKRALSARSSCHLLHFALPIPYL